ncbi:U-scoloptoxin(05)-Sm1a isoform X1 [Diprion similis]|uniref:U-scoloptoxin(05)-Sm1a isoform X1 n=1 Tax=Diprion similis TaxID=362088 RepID=UPI001EF7DB64|nr:U-scoloptoxin(05)-Sm1a isoform X1 [Diprion similis]
MGSSNKDRCLVIAALFVAYLELANAIECYQCLATDSNHPFQCNEFLSSDIDIQPQPCDNVYGAQYCIKHIGRFEGGIGTKRYCSSLDLGNYCNYVRQPGDKLEYRTCVYTCSGDGCNPASPTALPSMISLVFPSLIIGYVMICKR